MERSSAAEMGQSTRPEAEVSSLDNYKGISSTAELAKTKYEILAGGFV